MSESLLHVCVLCVLALSALSSACYIQNCPRGGKRSEPGRQCMACGPGNKGRCVGPRICCGAGLGCLLGSPETLNCMEENLLPGACESSGTPCGAEGACVPLQGSAATQRDVLWIQNVLKTSGFFRLKTALD